MYPTRPDHILIVETNYRQNEFRHEAEQRQWAREAAAVPPAARKTVRLLGITVAFFKPPHLLSSIKMLLARRPMASYGVKQG